MAGYVYLAHPFTDKNGAIVHYRYQIAMNAVAHFMERGEVVFSPIVHSFECAKKYQLPTEYRFWEHQNETMLKNASLLRILDLPGLEQSKGTAFEIMVANKYGIPIEVYHPGELETYRHYRERGVL